MTRWLITGAGGQLATHLVDRIGAGDDVLALRRADLDITSADAVDAAIAGFRPDVVLNAAAYTAVDAAETDEDAAHLVNATAPAVLAGALGRHGGRLIHVSTDYVFDGTVFDGTVFDGTVFDGTGVEGAARPYETGDPVAPRTAYGRTKLAGEQAVAAALPEHSHVVRTAWVYGGPGPNFVDTMRRLEGERETVLVVADQVGSPTWVGDLAAALIELGRAAAAPALLHYVNAGRASWFDLAREVFRRVGADPERVHATDSAAFTRPAPRPAWSVLSTTSWTDAGLSAPRPWQEALATAATAW